MATPDVNNIRSLEELSYMVSLLTFNMNKLGAIYYDLFVNPTPMDIELERYNDEGTLETIVVPNRAKDRLGSLSGAGSPEGKVIGRVGSLYIDTETATLYYKGSDVSESSGWVLLWNQSNFVDGTNFLSPTGDGRNLTNLDAASIAFGTLPIQRGGTSSTGFTGLVKANGTNPYAAAVDGVDYLGPNGSTGIICWYPVVQSGGSLVIPSGWLRCDGASYSTSTYARLFGKIGYTYGGSGSSFNVPNITDFIRSWDGVREAINVQNDSIKGHTHGVGTLTVGNESEHTHTRGTMNITGATMGMDDNSWSFEGAFYLMYYGGTSGGTANGARGGFDASRAWTGKTSGGTAHTHDLSGDTASTGDTETRPRNISMIPIIKY